MKFFILFMIFITISKTRTVSLLTGSYDQNSTDLINDRRELKEIDVLRQIINQETIIRLAMVKDVKAALDNVDSVKRSMASIETTISTLQQTMEALIRRVDAQSQSQDNSLQQTVEALKSQVDILSRENKKFTMDYQKRSQDVDLRFKILNENITDIYDHLNSNASQTAEKGFRLNADCMDLYLNGHTQSGVYKINPFGNESQINVYCDMVTEGGGWTAIQKRRSGSVSFNKTWVDYKKGFGTPEDSYWIGNDVIHRLCRGRNSFLYISITLQNDTKLHELYGQFSVSNETEKYRLFLGGPATGTLGDSMFNTEYPSYTDLSGMYFSTPDRDNDRFSGGHCASTWGGGWWFNDCRHAFLNGPWSSNSWTSPWFPTVKYGSEVKETLMMIKSH